MANGRRAGGRRKGSRNKGYFYRKERGWFCKEGSRFIPLTDEHGERLRAESTPEPELKDAYARLRIAKKQKPVAGEPESATVEQVCSAYLAKAKETAGENKTFRDRAETLFDFCYGLPPKFRTNGIKPEKTDRIHDGYGALSVGELLPLHVDKWLQSHPTWNGGKRSRIQAVKRSLNYAVEAGLISRNPIRGYKTPPVVGRVTYITPEQENALLERARPALAMAIRVLIRTGMRPGCEFAALTARHVRDDGQRIEIVFQAHESKTKRVRTVRVVDPATLATIREQVALHPAGAIFRQANGKPWLQKNLSLRFRKLKRAIEFRKDGPIEFDADCCVYSLRHTYAKRCLQGYWTSKQINIETLARLMGNSPAVCRAHYLNEDDTYNEPLWEAC